MSLFDYDETTSEQFKKTVSDKSETYYEMGKLLI